MPFNFQCIGTFEAHSGTVWNVAAYSRFLFTTGSDDRIVVWDLGAAQPSRKCELHGHNGVIHSMVAHEGFLYSGDSKTIRMWDLQDYTETTSWVASDDIICALAIMSNKLFSASYASIKVAWLKYCPLKRCRSGPCPAMTRQTWRSSMKSPRI